MAGFDLLQERPNLPEDIALNKLAGIEATLASKLRATEWLTRVKCGASVAKKCKIHQCCKTQHDKNYHYFYFSRASFSLLNSLVLLLFVSEISHWKDTAGWSPYWRMWPVMGLRWEWIWLLCSSPLPYHLLSSPPTLPPGWQKAL